MLRQIIIIIIIVKTRNIIYFIWWSIYFESGESLLFEKIYFKMDNL